MHRTAFLLLLIFVLGPPDVQGQRSIAKRLRLRLTTQREQPTGHGNETVPDYQYETKYFTQTLDHYTFTTDKTFQQKYLVNDTWWDKAGGPIFFYTGNEGLIEAFAQNSGFMWDIAQEFGAMLVFAEHRYYGSSLPFPDNSSSRDPSIVGYLTSELALADYANLVTYIKKTVDGTQDSPVIAFGGSYGGMLAAWFRLKFPHIVVGAIAASAPVAQFTDLTPCDAFGRIVTSDFTSIHKDCSSSIRSSWSVLSNVAGLSDLTNVTNGTGLEWINDNFNLCDPFTSPDNITVLKEYLTDLWIDLAMMNYPYPTTFLKPLPANPVAEACKSLSPPTAPFDKNLTEQLRLLESIYDAASVYFNYTGDATCLNLGEEDDIGADMWSYQACSEMVMPFCYDGTNDMFEASKWDLDAYTKQCQEEWGVTPRPYMAKRMYGGRNLKSASNIVFSNGLEDPWSSGGVISQKTTSKKVVAVLIPNGAHHLDLRAANTKDPNSVVQARDIERQNIEKWIKGTKTKDDANDRGIMLGDGQYRRSPNDIPRH
jgi:lysosomal Pro-X carboxypeptidase